MLLPRPVRLAVATVPLAITQRLVAALFRQALAQHPDVFDRLDVEAGKRFRFTPTDLGLSFIVQPAARTITVHRQAEAPAADATVSGPLLMLLALLEGRIDGDAAFFSRGLAVTGDMEAMLALRNALDDCGFDLPADLSGLAGPFARPFRRLAEAIRARALAGLA